MALRQTSTSTIEKTSQLYYILTISLRYYPYIIRVSSGIQFSIRVMDREHTKGIILASALGIAISSFGVYKAYKSYKKLWKKNDKLKKTLPIDVHEFKKMTMKKGDVFVLRVVPELENPKGQQKDLYSNYQYFCYPDERKYIKDKISQVQQDYERKVWKGHDLYEFTDAVNLKGLKEVFDGVLEVNVKAQISSDKLPFYKKLYQLFAGVIEYILGVVYLLLSVKYRSSVFLKGVKIGYFDVKYNWFKGHVLVQCEIGSEMIPEVQSISLSHDIILDDIEQRQNRSFARLLVSIGFWAIMVYIGYRLWKMKQRQRKNGIIQVFRNKQLQFEPQNEDQTCIICMTNNRNILFEDCYHLVICSTCLPAFDKNQCPICKASIRVKKVFSIK